MIVTVSTVKDSPATLTRWVQRNLRNGVDHLVVFVDDGDPAALEALSASPYVTAVDSASWWGAERPDRLNVRQRINANAVRAVVARVPGVDWIFHVDSDEVAVIDRDRLAALDPALGVVRLLPLEAVSRDEWPDDEVGAFKRLLDDDELTLIHTLGAVARPKNADYFHGHIGGKVGMRPGHDGWLGTHHVVGADRSRQPAFEADWLSLLHYESHTAAEFVRKWGNLATSGGPVTTRGARSALATSVQTLLAKRLDPEVTDRLLRRLFEMTTRDDHELLDSLGLLVRVDPRAGTHRPDPGAEPVAALRAALAGLHGRDKSGFEPGRSPDAAAADDAGRSPDDAAADDAAPARRGRPGWRRAAPGTR